MKQKVNIINSVVNSIYPSLNIIKQIISEDNKETFWSDLDKIHEIEEFLSKLEFKVRKELI